MAGVALADALVARELLEPGDGGFALTAAARDELGAFGLDVPAVLGARRATARACLDWSERRPHVGGALGAALLDELLGALAAPPPRRPRARRDPRRDGWIASAFGLDLLRSARTQSAVEEVATVPRMLETLRETFWILALAVIALFAFFAALGAFSPLDVLWATIAVGVLCVLWIMHAVLEDRHRDRRDPSVVRARERRGF